MFYSGLPTDISILCTGSIIWYTIDNNTPQIRRRLYRIQIQWNGHQGTYIRLSMVICETLLGGTDFEVNSQYVGVFIPIDLTVYKS